MKIFRKLKIYFLTAALVIASAGVFAPAASAAPDIELDCGAAILADMETGTVLYSKEADKRMYPASLTKIMTALVALDAFQNGQVTLNDRVTVSSTAFSDIPADGASLTPKLQEGEIMSLEDLLYCLIMTSANEPCNVVAEHVSGSVAEFVSDMNSMAQSLGCTGTHFTNTHGIHDTDQYSTAYDLMLIMRKAMSIPQFAKISGTYEYTVPATNLAGERSLRNTNDLLRESTASFYEYAKGGKTGYTNASGYCLASAAQKGEVYLVSVVLNTISVELPSGARQAKSFPETKKLYQWGFDNFSYRTVISTMNLVKEVPVALGNGAETVVLRPENSIVRLLDNDTDVKKVKLDIRLINDESGEELEAPISAGEILGEADVSLDGVSYGTVLLVANSTVELDRAKFISHEIAETMQNRYVKLSIVFLIILFIAYIAFIIIYNLNRRRKKKAADELARQRIEAIRAQENLTTGMSFEEIEKLHTEESRYRRR